MTKQSCFWNQGGFNLLAATNPITPGHILGSSSTKTNNPQCRIFSDATTEWIAGQPTLISRAKAVWPAALRTTPWPPDQPFKNSIPLWPPTHQIKALWVFPFWEGGGVEWCPNHPNWASPCAPHYLHQASPASVSQPSLSSLNISTKPFSRPTQLHTLYTYTSAYSTGITHSQEIQDQSQNYP